MTLHDHEIPVDAPLVRSLLVAQCPQWAGLPLSPAGAGTDNTVYRLGGELVVRLPRTVEHGDSVRKEQTWLPRLAPLLRGVRIPELVHAGVPEGACPAVWSVHRWIDGDTVGPDTVRDWPALGTDLAAFVRELHGTGLMGAERTGDLAGYRGGDLAPFAPRVDKAFAALRAVDGGALDIDTLERLWRAGLALPGAGGPRGWLHGDLKPGNLLVRDGRLHAVIDFGGLSVGLPDAEHAAVWDLPPQARQAYWDAADLSDATWSRARAWAIAVAVNGIPYYLRTYPAFVAECRARLAAVLADAAGR
ncbi:aminoglycoside phosphotransferase family protein [Streptomyces tsukubensis]|uniref:aminoglycoside phosphotransferase family protein n=1 Tax=Streptomyces tsukubensis TaxID=83656 RepID=UPI00368CB58F